MKNLFLTIVVLILQGCTSNLYVGESHYSEGQISEPKVVVYVVNPDHKNYDVLQKSGIYELSSDENILTRLTLQDAEVYFSCGNPVIGAFLTLGLLPAYFGASEEFRYTLEKNGSRDEFIHYLDMYERMSLWEWIAKPFIRSPTEVRANALSRAKRESYTRA